MTLILPEAELLAVPSDWRAYDLHYQSDYPGPRGDFSHPLGLAVAYGAGDPEADSAQRLCRREEVPFWNTRGVHGNRVEPYESYEGVLHDPRMLLISKLATFETAISGVTPAIALDHHGDKAPEGLDMSFENGFRASSLGQLVTWLENETGHDIKYTRTEEIVGRLDHRASQLLHTGFGDISPEEARHVFVHEVARSNRNEPLPSVESIKDVDRKIDQLSDFIASAPETEVNGAFVVDLRETLNLEAGYREDSLVLKAAASIPGRVAWARSPDNSPKQRVTELFTGLVTTDHIEAFRQMTEEKRMKIACIDEPRGIAIAYPEVATA
jgi:hypothetical protein